MEGKEPLAREGRAILKAGLTMMVVALVLAVGVAAAVALQRLEDPAPTAALAVDSLPAETATTKEVEENGFDPGEKLRIDDEPAPEEIPRSSLVEEREAKPPPVSTLDSTSDEPGAQEAPQRHPSEGRKKKKVEPPPPPAPADGSEIEAAPTEQAPQGSPPGRPNETIQTPPVVQEAQGRTESSRSGTPATATTNVVPRSYQPQQDARLSLTIGTIGLHGVPVANSDSRQDLDRGVIHLPQTPFPWDEREQKNVYLAGHRAGGYGGRGDSPLIFYNLNKLRKGDSIVLRDGSGNPYEYEVSEVFVVTPEAQWAVDPVRNRDMLTLQTCTYPDPKNRIIVRADRA